MADYNFSIHERWAVWNVHGEACYMCRRPVDMQSMQVDHVIPEHLDGKPELVEIIAQHGLSPSFNLNAYENWLPACATCNNRKRGTVFDPTPIVQVNLQVAAAKADQCREVEKEAVSSRKLSLALTHIARATVEGKIDFEVVEPILASWVARHRNKIAKILAAADAGDEHVPAPEIALTPFYKVLVRHEAYDIVRASYGTGAVPTAESPHSSFYCGHCGSLGPWSGARCMSCGYLDDGD